MTKINYDSSTGTIRADLAPDSRPVVHAGREGRSVVLHLTHPEAIHLRNQLGQAIHRAEQAKQGRSRRERFEGVLDPTTATATATVRIPRYQPVEPAPVETMMPLI